MAKRKKAGAAVRCWAVERLTTRKRRGLLKQAGGPLALAFRTRKQARLYMRVLRTLAVWAGIPLRVVRVEASFTWEVPAK